MSSINGYPAHEIETHYLANLTDYTASSIRSRIELLKNKIAENAQPVFVSLGENCGPGNRMRDAGVNTMGSNYFDNLVVRVENIPKILDCDSSGVLSLKSLSVGRWEAHDSVYDEEFAIYFHHYFHLPGRLEKDSMERGYRTRRIDEADIPLFLSQVRAQFEYLAVKFRLIAEAPFRKVYVVRQVEGGEMEESSLIPLEQALASFGAKNFELVQVVSRTDSTQPRDRHFRLVSILENGERWGSLSEWKAMSEAVLAPVTVGV